MALLGFLKKKKRVELELPPPPGADLSDIGEIPDIRVGEELPVPPKPKKQGEAEEQLPEFPSLPEEELSAEQPQQIEEVPAPRTLLEMPEEPKSGETRVVFDRTIQMPEDRPVEVIRRQGGMRKTFVSLDDYRAIAKSSELIRERLSEAEDVVRRLNELKNQENKTFDRWVAQLEDVEKKLSNIDKVLAKAHA